MDYYKSHNFLLKESIHSLTVAYAFAISNTQFALLFLKRKLKRTRSYLFEGKKKNKGIKGLYDRRKRRGMIDMKNGGSIKRGTVSLLSHAFI